MTPKRVPPHLTNEHIQFLDGPDGAQIDVTLTNGLITSTKTITKQHHNSFTVFHNIDGSWTAFTRSAIMQVLQGLRSPWDGDDDDD